MNEQDDLWDFSDIWALAINGSGVGLWDRDIVAGTIRYSRSWYAILGYDDMPALVPIEVAYGRVHPDDLGQVRRNMEAHFEWRSAVYEVEHRLRCKNGTYKWVLSRGKVIGRDDAGRPLRMVGTTTDITVMRTLAETLKSQYADAKERSAEMAALAEQLTERTLELAAAHRLAGVGSWQWDRVNRQLSFSPETWAIMGRPTSAEPVSYDQMREMYHPDDYHPTMAAYHDMIRTGLPARLEYRFVRPDGKVRFALTHAAPVIGRDGSIGLVRGTTQDITSYREIEGALRESEDHYRHMVDLHPQIPWTAGPDGAIIEVGPQWYRMTGMTMADTMPFGWLDVVHPDDRPGVVAVWQAGLTSGERVDTEYRVRSAGGDDVWLRARAAPRFDESGHIFRWYGTLEDVSDRRLAEQARRAADALAFRVLETTSDAVVVCDPSGRVTFANAKAIAQIGEDAELVGRQARQVFGGAHGRRVRQAIGRAVEAGANACFEAFWAPIDRWFEVHVFATANDISLFLRDITEKRLAQQKLDFAARHDLLTRTFNRDTFFTMLADELVSQQPGNLLALFCIDLEYFKDFNDTHGHPAGDALLRQVANRLQGCLRAQDRLARSGGDEFLILQTGLRSPADANVLAERIVKEMSEPFLVDERPLLSSLSIGIAVSVPDQTDPDHLYNQADLALYEAKDKARGGYRMFRPALQIESDEVRQIRNDLAAALRENQFRLAFQPIVRVADRQVVGVEALLRWQHPEYGLIAPARFIPIAEETGLIAGIGAWVLEHACAAATRWPLDVKVSVNVSPRQFALGDMLTVVRDALNHTGLAPHRLKLEVTESLLLSSNATNLRTLEALRGLGLFLVLDDFGTGYSSIAYLEAFKFDFLKIDRSFLSKITAPGNQQPILEATVALAKALGLPITAEGVETNIQLDYIQRLGCEYAQGYLFAKPL
ncbi:MAG: EAL domain-containing protein, partial [Proteobacteria bacterium]|nr:EAL domain-containing protein [Pseudomonadota bacterium]